MVSRGEIQSHLLYSKEKVGEDFDMCIHIQYIVFKSVW